MKHKLSLAVALALAAGAMSHRALGQIPGAFFPSLTIDEICFDLSLTYAPPPQGAYEVYFVPGHFNPWEIRIDFNSLVNPATITGYAWHYAPGHPGGIVPNPNGPWFFSFTTALVPDSRGPDDVWHPNPPMLYFDRFYAELNQVQGGYLLNVSGCHIPEPADYAALAGLGLVGFGAYRRFRKA